MLVKKSQLDKLHKQELVDEKFMDDQERKLNKSGVTKKETDQISVQVCKVFITKELKPATWLDVLKVIEENYRNKNSWIQSRTICLRYYDPQEKLDVEAEKTKYVATVNHYSKIAQVRATTQRCQTWDAYTIQSEKDNLLKAQENASVYDFNMGTVGRVKKSSDRIQTYYNCKYSLEMLSRSPDFDFYFRPENAIYRRMRAAARDQVIDETMLPDLIKKETRQHTNHIIMGYILNAYHHVNQAIVDRINSTSTQTLESEISQMNIDAHGVFRVPEKRFNPVIGKNLAKIYIEKQSSFKSVECTGDELFIICFTVLEQLGLPPIVFKNHLTLLLMATELATMFLQTFPDEDILHFLEYFSHWTIDQASEYRLATNHLLHLKIMNIPSMLLVSCYMLAVKFHDDFIADFGEVYKNHLNIRYQKQQYSQFPAFGVLQQHSNYVFMRFMTSSNVIQVNKGELSVKASTCFMKIMTKDLDESNPIHAAVFNRKDNPTPLEIAAENVMSDTTGRIFAKNFITYATTFNAQKHSNTTPQ